MVPMQSVYLRRIVQQQGDRPILRLTKPSYSTQNIYNSQWHPKYMEICYYPLPEKLKTFTTYETGLECRDATQTYP